MFCIHWINKHQNVGNRLRKAYKSCSAEGKTTAFSLPTHNFEFHVDPPQISQLNCLKCERVIVKVLRWNWWLGNTLCHWSWALSLQPLTTLSVMFTASQLLASTSFPSHRRHRLRATAPHHASFPSIRCTQKPLTTQQKQTAYFGQWLQLLIGSYNNGHLPPYCLIG